MVINGLQKLTLLDFPGRVACTVFLAGCDMRCPFCHNNELWSMSAPAFMDEEEFFAFLNKRKGMLDGVCLTGGEPTLRKELPVFLARIKELGCAVKLDSNGGRPNVLRDLIADGLVDYIAMDIKNDLPRYALTCGLESFDTVPIEKSVSLLLEGRVPYEFRTTVVDELHDEESFYNIRRLIDGAEGYYLQAFTDRDTVKFAGFHAPSDEKMDRYLAIVKPFVKRAEIRGR